jgi:hypothetical protein
VKVTLKIARSMSAGLPVAGSFSSVLRRSGRLSAPLMSGAAVAALLAMGTVAAKADDPSVAVQIKELKAQIRMLERRMDQQSNVVIRQAQGGPIVKGPYPYAPPEPWDKKFHLNGITITPGGFLAAEGVFRTRDTGGDFSPAFGSLDSYTSPNAHLQELRGTARQSRISALVQGNYNPDVLISGYGEFDFLGAGDTANSTESNSYQPRVRHLYGTIDWADEGFHVLAGQTWSLATLQGKGISPRNEVIPTTIDAQYVAGFTWARQPGIRITKNFGDEFWVAASAELSQTTPCATSDATGASAAGTQVGTNLVFCSQNAGGGSGLLNTQYEYSFNHIPDVIAKAAWEPTMGDRTLHIEGFGLYTDEYDYVENGIAAPVAPAVQALSLNNNRFDTSGWGAGGGITIPVMPKLVDVQGSGMIGRGIGRYGSAQLSDATFNPNGSLDPLPEFMFLGGATVHATPELDLYAYGGEERILSSDFTSTKGAGYVSPTANNSQCYFVGASTASGGGCVGKVQDAWELTAGFWDKVYEGNFGSVRVGLQYVYAQDDLFPGSGNTAGFAANTNVHYNDNMVYASFRYYPFDPPPAAPALVAKY